MAKKENNRITAAYVLSHREMSGEVGRLEEKYGINLIPIAKIAPEGGDTVTLPVLRITKNKLILEDNGHTLFFHPSMALLRLLNIRRGGGDRFLQAAKIMEGDMVLDATMGLASDALIAAWAVGERGRVIALEASPLIHLLVDDGLKRLEKLKPKGIKNKEKEKAWSLLAQASSRIQTIQADHISYLEGAGDASQDIIYFDPMFRVTVEQSAAMRPLKNWSCADPLSPETIELAGRAARKRLVLKEKRNSGEFERLGFKVIEGSQYNPVCFGVIELTEKGRRKACSP